MIWPGDRPARIVPTCAAGDEPTIPAAVGRLVSDPVGSGRTRYFNGTDRTNDYADVAGSFASPPRRRRRGLPRALIFVAPLPVGIPIGVYMKWNPSHDSHKAFMKPL